MKYFWIAFSLCFTILGIRSYDRFLHPEIWAEDGTRCLQVVTASGLRSLFDFSDGYFYVLQKLVAHLSIQLVPVETIPLAILIIVWMLTSAVFALFSLRTFEWLVPDVRLRVIGCVFFCFSPGLQEVFGNLANLPSVLFLLLCLIAIRDPRKKESYLMLTLCTLVFLSSGTFIVLAPVFLIRRDFKVIALMVFAVIGITVQSSGASRSVFDVMQHIPTILVPYAIRGLLLQPWLGDTLTSALNNPHIKFWQFTVAIAVVTVTVLLLWKRRHEKGFFLLFVFLISVCSWPLLGWITWPLSFPRFVGIPELFWKDRYSFILGTVSTLFWLWAISNHRLQKILLFVFMVSHTLLNAYRFKLPRYIEKEIWSPKVAEIRSLKEQGKCAEVSIEGIPREYDWIYSVTSCVK